MSIYLFWPNRDQVTKAGFESVAQVPCIFDEDWQYHKILSRYMRDRALASTRMNVKRFDKVMQIADKVIVPLQPSIFDILATQEFLQKLKSTKGKFDLGVLGMRVNGRMRAADQLTQYVNGLGIPVLGFLRDTQNYVQLAANGATLWDVAPSRVEKDMEQWQELLQWVEKK